MGLSASMRTVAPETTLLYARHLAAAAGISDVTDITGLDVLGVPVCVSVRPQARGESFTFGKGLRAVEAEVGAYMEALEFFSPNRGMAMSQLGGGRRGTFPGRSGRVMRSWISLRYCTVKSISTLLYC